MPSVFCHPPALAYKDLNCVDVQTQKLYARLLEGASTLKIRLFVVDQKPCKGSFNPFSADCSHAYAQGPNQPRGRYLHHHCILKDP